MQIYATIAKHYEVRGAHWDGDNLWITFKDNAGALALDRQDAIELRDKLTEMLGG